MNGELDREILQGRVFQDAEKAERAVHRATDIVADLRNRDVIIRAGWWGPLGVAVIVTARGVMTRHHRDVSRAGLSR